MLDWLTHKDITRIAHWVDPHMLGVFVKAVIRVSSYLDIVKEAHTLTILGGAAGDGQGDGDCGGGGW